MICGASAVNAVAPVAGAHREEQGIAIGVVFLFSVVALLAFRPIAAARRARLRRIAGLWSGLAVNDLSSAIAVGSADGRRRRRHGRGVEVGARAAARADAGRALAAAPRGRAESSVKQERRRARSRASCSATSRSRSLRALGDRLVGGAPAWTAVLDADKLARRPPDGRPCRPASASTSRCARSSRSSARAIAVGGGASVWMAALTLAMIVAASRGAPAAAALVGARRLVVSSFVAYRAGSRARRASFARLRGRFDERRAALARRGDAAARRGRARRRASTTRSCAACSRQLHPSIGELIPVRESPLAARRGLPLGDLLGGRERLGAGRGLPRAGLGRRRSTRTRIACSARRSRASSRSCASSERGDGRSVELVDRARCSATTSSSRPTGSRRSTSSASWAPRPAIDLQLRGPEVGQPGPPLPRPPSRSTSTRSRVGARVSRRGGIDDRPGHGGEGAAAGRRPRVRRLRCIEAAMSDRGRGDQQHQLQDVPARQRSAGGAGRSGARAIRHLPAGARRARTDAATWCSRRTCTPIT